MEMRLLPSIDTLFSFSALSSALLSYDASSKAFFNGLKFCWHYV